MEDTIAAISTSTVSSGGISVVRISGENALSVAQQVFRSKKNKNVEDMESHTVHYGNIYNGEELIDEVLMVVMKAPNTYTREDVVEINLCLKPLKKALCLIKIGVHKITGCIKAAAVRKRGQGNEV